MSWFDRLANKLLVIAGIDEELADPVRAGLRSVPDRAPVPHDVDIESEAGRARLLRDYRPFTTEFDLESTAAEATARLENSGDSSGTDALWASTAYPASLKDEWVRNHASWSGWTATSVTLLLDHSGSMRDQGRVRATAAARLFASVLAELRTSFEVLGFTTRSWKGGQSRQKWLAEGKPARPGRLCDLLHLVYGDQRLVDEREFRLMLDPNVLRENVDGEAVQWAISRLLARDESRKLLIVVSDGAPSDDSTSAANGEWLLEAHLAAVLDEITRDRLVQIAAINVGPAASRYPNARLADSPAAAQTAILEVLAELSA